MPVLRYMISRLLFPLLLLLACKERTSETLTVKDRFLYSPDGQKVIIRGVNEMFIWSDDIIGESVFPEIAKTGANAVRIVWVSDKLVPEASPENLDQVIRNCKRQNMIPIVELHGATGVWNRLEEQVDYWTSDQVVKILKKHEQYLLVNIANEAGDWSVTPDQFIEGYKQSVSRIRATGINAPLIIDAAGWGQNIDILQETFKPLIDYDPRHNLLFSIHIWWAGPDGSTDRIHSEIDESVKLGLPLLVGEFAPMAVKCKGSIDYDAILRLCQEEEIGWLAWSWGFVNNKDCAGMDMTQNNLAGKYEGLYGWGREVSIDHPYSISNTSVKLQDPEVSPDMILGSVSR